ncbi:MAG TPA: NADH-quinone oxidoreductase subunit C [Acidimicrobiia bacterium]|nr:NADH-quinone oxidoreductase subunit C [Acidimicrobiia bacterium]
MTRVETVAASMEGAVVADSLGQTVVRVPRESLVAAVTAARDAGFTMFIDLCAVDYLTRDPRFEVVVGLLSLDPPERIRLLVGVPGDDASVPSITGVFAGADFYEREAFDLFGIDFAGHPDLTRILLPDDWQGHPLRKDTPVGSVPVQFKEANRAT